MPRTKFVAGNWKMHGSLAGNLALLSAVRAGAAGLKAQMAVCVPYPYLAQAQSVLAGSNVAWGAQDISEHIQGAYTGEVSGTMLSDFGCRYVIIGHSERRSYYGDTDAVVAAKFAASLKAGETPTLLLRW
jgi:triosephosphate isomerase